MDGPEEDDSASRGSLLLSQLDRIFVSDPLIDELGFVHPVQLASLHASDDSSASDSAFPNGESSNGGSGSGGAEGPQARGDCSRKSEHGVDELDDVGFSALEDEVGVAGGVDGVPYDATAFWCGDHKLAISILALPPLYRCARAVFMSVRADYKKLLQAEEEGNHDGRLNGGSEKLRLEDSLMRSSRALVLINCDYASAWSSRRQIILYRAVDQEVLSQELRMAGLVLSCGPKSEETWAYRRWIIDQMIAGGLPQAELDVILEAESKLVEGVAERSLMNYRAWRHRCWLVTHMSTAQVGVELNRTKAWASSHVADNCCLHYRRSLLLQFVKAKEPELNQISFPKITTIKEELDMKPLGVALLDESEMAPFWKEEVDWIRSLIGIYIGREALWIHLRFLSLVWVGQIGPMASCKRVSWDLTESIQAIRSEQNFVNGCFVASSTDLTEAGVRQREFAAAYKLWVTMLGQRQLKEKGRNGCQISPYQDDFNNLEKLLHDVVPHRKQLWAGLLPNLECASGDLSHSLGAKN